MEIEEKQETNRICLKSHYMKVSSPYTQITFSFSHCGRDFENYSVYLWVFNAVSQIVVSENY